MKSMEGEQDARPSEQAVVLEFDPFIACLKANASDSHVSLQHLSLEDYEGVRELAEALSCNTTLQSMDLSCTNLQEEGALLILDALANHNFSLTRLDLAGNPSIERLTIKKINSFLQRNEEIGQQQIEPQYKSPISWLPVELLHIVLSNCDIYQVLHLRSVCSQWKELIEGSSCCATLDLSKFPWKRKPLRNTPIPRYKEHLERLDYLPISVIEPSGEVIRDFLERYSRCFKSLTSLTLPLEFSIDDVKDVLLNCNPTLLRHLSMQNVQWTKVCIPTEIALVIKAMINLEYLNLTGCVLEIDTLLEILPTTTRLRTLVLLKITFEYRHESRLINAFRKMTQLEYLALSLGPSILPLEGFNRYLTDEAESLRVFVVDHPNSGLFRNDRVETCSMNLKALPFGSLRVLIDQMGISIDLEHLINDDYPNTVLIRAIRDNNVERVNFCLANGAQPNQGHVALAVRLDAFSLVQKLCRHGIRMQRGGEFSFLPHIRIAPLFEAFGSKHMLQYLLGVGFDPFDYAGVSTNDRSALNRAICYGRKDEFKMILQYEGRADKPDKKTKMTAIMHLVCSSWAVDVQILEELVARGADINAKASRKMGHCTALHFAVKHNEEWIAPLVSMGADLRATTRFGFPPLAWAKKFKKEAAVDILSRLSGNMKLVHARSKKERKNGTKGFQNRRKR